MKASEFKKILKPLVEQTVKEVLLHDGVLSKVVSEVARGLTTTLMSESSQSVRKTASNKNNDETEKEYLKKKQERIKRLNESMPFETSVFEGVSEMPKESSSGPLSGVASADSGIDISAIQKLSSGKWKKLAGNK